MKLVLVRYGLGDESTLGRLYIDGAFVCFTLEDERRKVKVPGETCIPEGEYRIELRTEGAMHPKYAERFKPFHRGMLWLRDVPGFEFIYLHAGNTPKETLGCPLIGARPFIGLEGEFELRESEIAYRHVAPAITDRIVAKEKVTVHIRSAA
jgi:hypothetical protein